MARSHAPLSRSRSRGVTPFAAALAVLGLGASASGLWWAASAGAGRDALSSSRADATAIQAAAKSFRAQHADGCPTLSSLQEEQFLSRNARQDDAWGNRFRVRCDDGDPEVSSAGPDGKANTADDIRIAR
jgi:general secretion pathway protein G